ncbi:MAG TPA: PspC domain-containing protein [Acidothermaceae bacterium]|nr:PspC domain-containing protein [Acidothermaceae bacterium]
MTQDSSSSRPHQDIRTLRRSTGDRVIAGVCGGLGRYSGIDPIVFRITFAVLAVFGGAGLLLYAIAWLVVPDDTTSQSELQRLLHGRASLYPLLAIIIGALGLVTLIDLAHRGWPGPVPAIILVAALIALVGYRRDWTWHEHQPPAPAAPPSAEPTAESAAATQTEPLGPPAGYAPSRPIWSPYDDEPPPYTMPPAPQPPRPPRPPSLLAPIGICLGVVVAGVMLALGASHAFDITAESVFAAALLTVGLALVVGTWIGRGRGLIVVGSFLTVGLIIAAILDVPLRGGIGNRTDAPTRLSDLRSSYHLAVGRQDLDLTAVPFNGKTVHVDATVGLGDLRVTVPSNTKVVVHATNGAGEIRLPDNDFNGTQLTRDFTVAATDGPQTGEIDLDLHVGVGEVEIYQAPAVTSPDETGVQQ